LEKALFFGPIYSIEFLFYMFFYIIKSNRYIYREVTKFIVYKYPDSSNHLQITRRIKL